jgi:hypothetical protein
MSIKDEAIKEIELRLGGGMVDVELDLAHYELAINRALRKYRQRASNSVIESFIPLQINAEQQVYQVPLNVVNVREIIKRFQGSISSGAGVDFEPFNAVYLSNLMLQGNGFGQNLVNYELYAHRRDLIARMFGAYVTFTWNRGDKTIFIHRKFNAEDEIFLWCDVERSDDDIMTDTYAGSWVKDYAFAHAKFMLGEARSKFATIAGPQGGTSLNGDNLKSEAQAELEKLDEDLKTYIDGSTPLGFIIG